MSSCPSGKRSFYNQSLAEEALVEHLIRFNHPEGTGPVNVYLCDDCGEYHFTSKGPMSELLSKKSEYIQKQQFSRNWENRLR